MRSVIGVALCVALAFGGCASDMPTRYFALEAILPSAAAGVAPSAAATRAGLPLEVRSVQIPPTLDRVELVRQLPRGEIGVRDFSHWAAPLGRMTRQVLTEDLALRLPVNQVVFPGAAGPDGRSSLTVDILSFTVADGTATMRVSWTLRRPPPSASDAADAAPSRPEVGLRSASLRLAVEAGDGDAATARAWSALIGQLADDVAKAVAAR